MYKKQMVLQRILCVAFIIASVLVFIYALGFMTDVYDMINPLSSSKKTDEMRQLMTDMDLFDRDFVKAGIGLVIVSLALFLTNTHTRRKYYIGNYIAVALTAGAAGAAAAWAHGQIGGLKERYFSGILNFEEIQKALDPHPGRRPPLGVFTDSAFWFDAHYFVFGILLLAAVLLILNAIWKISLMRQEKAALTAGKAVD